jgi:hypothetical protein
VLELYLQVNAHPKNPGGLAPSTYERYESTVGLHMLDKPRARGSGRLVPPRPYAVALCAVPAVRFNQPQAPAAWREQMLREGVPKASRQKAWRVLSAALGWAASSNLVGEIHTNGCSFAPEPRGNIRRNGPRPADTEWRAARTEQADRQALRSPPSALVVSNRAHPRGKIRNWLDTHRRRTRGV